MQAHAVRTLGNEWRSHLGRDSQVHLVVDGMEGKVPPGLDELSETAGVSLLGGLPMDWRHRLMAMNSGLPIQEQSSRCRYSRSLQTLMNKLESQQENSIGESWWQRLRSNG